MRRHSFVSRQQTLLAAIALATTLGSDLQAQCRLEPLPKPGPGKIVGMINDANGGALDSVMVFIASPRRQTRSAGGMYTLNDVEKDTVVVQARIPGYQARTRRLYVGDSGAVASFCMPKLAPTLDPVISSAQRGGLYGVVADSDFAVIPGAEIKVIGAGEDTKTDTTGSFYINLKAGHYLVRVSRPGFESKNVSVTVPRDSGRKMLVWLNTASAAAAARDEWNAFEFQQRIIHANPVYTRIVTHEDILKSGMTEGIQVARSAAVAPVSDTCWVTVVEGSTHREPLWAVQAADLEMMEVYAARPGRSTSTSIAAGPRRPAPPLFSGCPAMYAWIRK